MFIDLPPVEPTVEVVITSDYVRDGLSLTDGKAAFQGSATLEAGYVYVRAVGTVADFSEVYDADAELRLSVGTTTTVAGFDLDLSANYTSYHGVRPGADREETDYRLTVSRDFGKVSTDFTVQYNPDVIGDLGSETLVQAQAGVPVGHGVNLSGGFGRVFADYADYNIWNVGATRNITDNVALDVRYHDAKTSTGRLGDLSDDRVVVSLKASF